MLENVHMSAMYASHATAVAWAKKKHYTGTALVALSLSLIQKRCWMSTTTFIMHLIMHLGLLIFCAQGGIHSTKYTFFDPGGQLLTWCRLASHERRRPVVLGKS